MQRFLCVLLVSTAISSPGWAADDTSDAVRVIRVNASDFGDAASGGNSSNDDGGGNAVSDSGSGSDAASAAPSASSQPSGGSSGSGGSPQGSSGNQTNAQQDGHDAHHHHREEWRRKEMARMREERKERHEAWREREKRHQEHKAAAKPTFSKPHMASNAVHQVGASPHMAVRKETPVNHTHEGWHPQMRRHMLEHEAEARHQQRMGMWQQKGPARPNGKPMHG